MTEDDAHDLKDTVRAAIFGAEVEQFINSPIGAFLLNRAAEEEQDGLNDLVRCSPSDVKRLVELQSKVLRARSIRVWLSEAVHEGLTALGIIEDHEHGN
jgi:hypothetical protein